MTKNNKQFGRKTSTTWHICLKVIGICNTHTIILGYQRQFPTFCFQVTSSVNCICLLTASIRTRSDDGNHQNKSFDGEHCFFYLRKCGFNWTQDVAVHKFINWTRSIYIERTNNPCLNIIKRLCLSLNNMHGPETTLKLGFFVQKSDKNTLQTCVNFAFEYLQA